MILEARITRLLRENGPMHYEELSDAIYACEHCGKVTKNEHDRVAKTVNKMHRENKITDAIDRKIALRGER